MKRNLLKSTITLAISATALVGFVNVTPKVIYGNDDRLDVYEVPQADVREVADSTVALIASKDIVNIGNGLVKIQANSFGDQMGLCAEERFFEQPSVANCSGSLVGDDLIATAGHCISASDCGNYSFVFGYRMVNSKEAQLELPQGEVYNCKAIVAREYSQNQDYALVRLDRPVRGHRVLKLQQSEAQPKDEIYVVGHPSGLPTKVADGARVRSQEGAFFVANMDTYGGNSGSAVFNAQTNEVVGILVRGAQDFNYDRNRQCYTSNKCTNSTCRGEDATNISYVIKALKR